MKQTCIEAITVRHFFLLYTGVVKMFEILTIFPLVGGGYIVSAVASVPENQVISYDREWQGQTASLAKGKALNAIFARRKVAEVDRVSD